MPGWNPYPPLPRETVRDLLGLTRVLYRATEPHDVVRLQELAEIGKALREALVGSKKHPGTIPHQFAWEAAEKATARLCALVQSDAAMAAALAPTAARIKRASLF